MKRLLGIIGRNNDEKFLFQENGTISIVNSRDFIKPPNYNLIKNRNSLIGTSPVSGETVFNFRYGPVTGGVAEAGIYNIHTSGEKILSVTIDLTVKRRKIEELMQGKSIDECLKLSENICGNFAFSHSVAFTRAIEKISNMETEEFVKVCRVICLELERIYNHFYVIAELAKGAAQKVLTSHLQYIFEECLRTNEIFSGSRHLLGFNEVANIGKIPTKDNIINILSRIKDIETRFEYLYEKSLESGNYLDRLHNTGIISKDKALEIGLTGPSLRASGIKEDLREYDTYYGKLEIPVKEEGDSLARMEVRAEEIFISISLIKNLLNKLLEMKSSNKSNYTIKDGEGFACVESPSGTICYFLEIKNCKIEYCHVVTPSLFGFQAIAESLVGQIFTDFVFTVESFGVNFADAAR